MVWLYLYYIFIHTWRFPFTFWIVSLQTFFNAVLSLCILEHLCYTDDVFDTWKRNYIHKLILLGASQCDGAQAPQTWIWFYKRALKIVQQAE